MAPRRTRSPASAAILARHAHPDDGAAILATVASLAARAGGRLARAHGQSLEDWLDDQHERAISCGLLARMRHVGPPTTPHVVGGRVARDRRGRILVAVTDVGPADYQGQLPGGIAVAVEAKSRAARLGLHEIPAHQAEDLGACADGGGLAVLVAELAGTIHAIHWREVPWASPRGGRPSIGREDVARWAVDPRCLLHPLDAEWRCYLGPHLTRAAAPAAPSERPAATDAPAAAPSARTGHQRASTEAP